MKNKLVKGYAATSALALMLCGPAMAATPSAQGAQGQSSGSQSASQAQAPDLSQAFTADKLMDMDVQNRQGEKLGKISNLVVEPDGKVSYVILEHGGIAGIGGQKYAVPFDRVQLSKGQKVAIVDVPQNRLSAEFAAFEERQTQEQQRQPGSDSGTQPQSSSGASSQQQSGGGSTQ